MSVWPDSLPVATRAGNALSPMESTIRTEMEAGARRVRRVTFARRDLLEVGWRFDNAQMELFRAFVDSDLRSLIGDSDTLSEVWTSPGATAYASPLPGPLSSGVAATRIVEDSSPSTWHGMSRSLSGLLTASTTYVLHATLRAAGRNWARVGLVDLAGVRHAAWINLSSGALGSVEGSPSHASRRSRDGGWWRVTIEASSASGSEAGAIGLFLGIGDGGATYTGNGLDGIDVCEVMLRQRTGFDLFARTDATGYVKGANGGQAWVWLPVAAGGGIDRLQARFAEPFRARALPGWNWDVTARIEVRNA